MHSCCVFQGKSDYPEPLCSNCNLLKLLTKADRLGSNISNHPANNSFCRDLSQCRWGGEGNSIHFSLTLFGGKFASSRIVHSSFLFNSLIRQS